MPAWGDIYNTLISNRLGVEQQNANLQITQAKTQLIQQQVQGEQKFNAALAGLDAARQQQQDSAQPVPPDVAAFGNTSLGKPILDGYQSETQSAKTNRMLANTALQAGLFDKYQSLTKDANDAENRARQWYAQGLNLAKQQREDVASIASSYAEDGSNLPDVVDAIKAIDPKALRSAQFNRDANGNITAGPGTAAAMTSVADSNMKRSDQLAAKREADKIKQEGITNERKERELKETERKDDARFAQMQHGMNVTDRRLALAEKAAAGSKDDSQRESDGAMVATGMPLSQAVPGWGAAAVNLREAAKKEALRQIKDELGVDDRQAGKELAQRQIDYAAGRRSTTQLNTMLGATRQAVKQLEFNVDQTKKILKDIPSTDLSPLINSLVRGEERWTGDPRYASLYFYMHAVAMESARILQGGQASIAQLHQGAAEEARKWADIGLTPKMFDSVAKSILEEGGARIKTYQDAMSEQRVGRPAGPASAAPAAGKTVDWSELK